MNIVVTGGMGYIGSVLVPRLLSEKHNVTVIDSLKYKQKSLLNCCSDVNFDIQIEDIRNFSRIKKYVNKADCIIHLAALVGVGECDKSEFETLSTNVDATRQIVSSLSSEQIMLFPCTNSGYGIGQTDMHCTEESPLKPISLYGQTKVKAEEIVLSRENSISFRLATVFGSSPSMRTELLVNDFVLRAIRDKFIVLFESHFKRNFIHIKDVANAFVMGINNFNVMKSNVYNVGLSSANLSKLELCDAIKKHIEFVVVQSDFMKDPDQRNYIVSNDKIEKLGFKPECSIEDGILELQKVYKITKQPYYS